MRGPADIIRGVLRLRGSVDQELAIVAKLLKPAGHVRGLILDDCDCNAGFRAEVGGSHFRAKFFFGVDGGTERSDFANAFSRKAPLMTGAVHGLVQRCGVVFLSTREKFARR